jgi:hypothetical protein
MAEPDTLLSTRQLLTALITTIATSTEQERGTANPLSNASPNTKLALLTLHALFPNDLLPALDLLDRGLVTRFVLASNNSIETAEQAPHTQTITTEETQNHTGRKQTLAYYVRTAQKPSSRSRAAAAVTQATTSYEVHLTTWSCSCPAFAFAAFPANLSSEGDEGHVAVTGGEDTDGEDWFVETGWRFGGLTQGNDIPACKHLLACMIAEKCVGFERLVEEKEVGVEEVAGWAAGWGD